MLARIRTAADDREEGFTLIELLVVMIIVGILAAIAIPTFVSQKAKARESSAKADAKAIATAAESILTDGSPAKDVTITGTARAFTIPETTTTTTATGRLSPGNTVTGQRRLKTDGSYCVAVSTQDSKIWSVADGQLTTGDCK